MKVRIQVLHTYELNLRGNGLGTVRTLERMYQNEMLTQAKFIGETVLSMTTPSGDFIYEFADADDDLPMPGMEHDARHCDRCRRLLPLMQNELHEKHSKEDE